MKGVGDPDGATARVLKTNSGDFIFDRWSWKADFHGAAGNTDAVGVVCDIVCRRRVRRRDTENEAMAAIVSAIQ